MIWGIWQFFSRALKIGTLMGSFNPNLKKHELKIHRGVICHHNEELRKTWRGTDLSFQRWHEEIDEFSPEHLESIKNFHFNGFLLSKIYIVWAKKVQRTYRSWNWKEIQNLERNRLQNWQKEFDKFWPELSKVSKIFTLMCTFWAKYKLFELKKYKGVFFPETEERCKIWRVIDLSFQNWNKEFEKFWSWHAKVSKFFTLMGFYWGKYILFELKK